MPALAAPRIFFCAVAFGIPFDVAAESPSSDIPGCPNTRDISKPSPYEDWCGISKIRRFLTTAAAEQFFNEQTAEHGLIRDGKDVFSPAPAQPAFRSHNGENPYASPTLSLWNLYPDIDYPYPVDELYSVDSYENRAVEPYETTQHLLAINERVWKAIGAKEATQRIPFTRRPRVAVIDTGIYAHKEFWRTGPLDYSLVKWYEANPDVLGPGCAGGYCCESIDEPPIVSSHATQVAGLIAADEDDTGIAGLGEANELMSIRVLEMPTGCFRRKRLVAGFECAIRQNADIINISMQSQKGAQCPQDLYMAMLQDSRKRSPGPGPALVVLAAGNKSCDLCSDKCKVWPGAIELPWVISVEALELSNKRIERSNHGKSADLAVPAPMEQLLCTTTSKNPANPNKHTCTDGYSRFAETSAASALVTGAATRVWGHPNFDRCNATQIRRVLRGFGKPLSQNNPPSCRMQIDFLYTVERDAGGNAIDLCACPEMNASDACGDLREQSQLCRSGTPKKPPQPWRSACDGSCGQVN